MSFNGRINLSSPPKRELESEPKEQPKLKLASDEPSSGKASKVRRIGMSELHWSCRHVRLFDDEIKIINCVGCEKLHMVRFAINHCMRCCKKEKLHFDADENLRFTLTEKGKYFYCCNARSEYADQNWKILPEWTGMDGLTKSERKRKRPDDDSQ